MPKGLGQEFLSLSVRIKILESIEVSVSLNYQKHNRYTVTLKSLLTSLIVSLLGNPSPQGKLFVSVSEKHGFSS